MALALPVAGSALNSPSHSLLHRQIAIDTAASEQSMVINSTDYVGIGTASPNQLLTVENSISLKEISAANADTAAYGQIWVKDDAPNTLWFTDDAGTDFQIGQTLPVKATGAEINTGTDDAKFATAKALADSNFTKSALPLTGGTMTGVITLGENTSIALDPAGSADGKYSGITIAGTAGATLAFGDVVYLAVADSKWELTDASAVATAKGMVGICVLAGNADAATTILLKGTIRADAAFPTLTVGAPVYMSETAGDVVVTAPSTTDAVVRVLGFALTANEMYWDCSPDYLTVV